MPSLFQSLLNRDLGHLRIVAQFWGIELAASERKAARKELSERLLNAELAAEVLEALPENAQNAVQTLAQHQGKLAWSTFERQFGIIREVGAGKRDREAIHLNPVSAAESLFYRALLARAFFDTPNGAEEFAYIPDDLFEMIHPEGHKAPKEEEQFGRLARPEERAHITLAHDFLLDDLTQTLAAYRMGLAQTPLPLSTPQRLARDLLLAARLIRPSPAGEGDGGEGIQADAVKSHLEDSRVNAFKALIQAWYESEMFDELRQIPALICEGEWENHPRETRHALLAMLETIPRGKWWSLSAFIADVKEKNPDFQRKAGNYDAWFIRRAVDDAHLRGFEHWDAVEGALIRYLIGEVLHRLGRVDIATAQEDGEITAFRIREGLPETPLAAPKLMLDSKGEISLSRTISRAAHYQVARFGEWKESKTPDIYRYQLSSRSLQRAKTQGLKIEHLLRLLKEYGTEKTPPIVLRALRRWAVNGTEARVESISVLRLSKPEDLRALRQSKAKRFLGDVLGPTTVVVQTGASEKVMAALMEMGIFMEDLTSET